MIDQIKSAYNHCDQDNCHERHASSFYLNDANDSKCQASTNKIGATCFIENSNSKEIDFLAIDACLIPETRDIKKCDAVVYDELIIWFIELKEVQWSKSSSLNRRKRKNARIKGVKQLASTILDFKNKGVNLDQIKVAGLISFPPFIDVDNPISIPTTSSQERVLEFASLCGYSDLFEGNHIVFH